MCFLQALYQAGRHYECLDGMHAPAAGVFVQRARTEPRKWVALTPWRVAGGCQDRISALPAQTPGRGCAAPQAGGADAGDADVPALGPGAQRAAGAYAGAASARAATAVAAEHPPHPAAPGAARAAADAAGGGAAAGPAAEDAPRGGFGSGGRSAAAAAALERAGAGGADAGGARAAPAAARAAAPAPAPARGASTSILSQTAAALGLWEQLHETASTPSTVLAPGAARRRARAAASLSTDQSGT